ncbi:hypothetical protein HanIR_Chr17g0896411 [Helianthus annuus]|nr:hypothetical protein HanIR_Chr17g0896411 [Helianthus annuus]
MRSPGTSHRLHTHPMKTQGMNLLPHTHILMNQCMSLHTHTLRNHNMSLHLHMLIMRNYGINNPPHISIIKNKVTTLIHHILTMMNNGVNHLLHISIMRNQGSNFRIQAVGAVICRLRLMSSLGFVADLITDYVIIFDDCITMMTSSLHRHIRQNWNGPIRIRVSRLKYVNCMCPFE